MEDSYELYRVLLYTLIVIQVAPVESQDDVYLQIYPQVNVTDARTPLYFALMLSFGGDYTSIGALPGVQIALDYINNEPSILPNYTLHYTLTDSQVNCQPNGCMRVATLNFPCMKSSAGLCLVERLLYCSCILTTYYLRDCVCAYTDGFIVD